MVVGGCSIDSRREVVRNNLGQIVGRQIDEAYVPS